MAWQRKDRRFSMEKTTVQAPVKSSVPVAIVSGLFNGLLGGIAMALVLAGYSIAAGTGIDYLGYFSTETPVPAYQGLLGHLAVSSIYGMLYGLIHRGVVNTRLQSLPGWLTGLAYGMLLWGFAVTILLPAAKSIMLTLAWPAFFFGHIAYGLVLGARQK